MSKLLLQSIRREPTPRRPLWIMRQAGRYLPEYRELRKAHSFKALSGNAELAREVTLMPMRRFPLDAAIVFADIMSPLPALGVDFDFDPGPVVANPIRDARGIAELQDPDPEKTAPEVIQALKLSRAELPTPRHCWVSVARHGRLLLTSLKAAVSVNSRHCVHLQPASPIFSTTYSAN